MDWPLLAPLSQIERDALLGAMHRRTFAKGEVVFHEGDPADSMHLVSSGFLGVRVSTPDGDSAMLSVVGPGAHVGELALVDREHSSLRSATVAALQPAETLVLGVREFQELRRTVPGFQAVLLDLLADRIRQLSSALLRTMYVSLDRRLCGALADLADLYGASGAAAVIPLTQEQLADLVGGTRPSVNQALGALQELGIIDVGRGRLTVKDRAALAARL